MRTVMGLSHINARTEQYSKDAFAKFPWTKQYWRRHHGLVQDIVAVHGQPDLFITIAPWEWDLPWPEWVNWAGDLFKLAPTDCIVPEALAIAHLLHQLTAGVLYGNTCGNTWKHHYFGDGTDENNCLVFFARF